MSLVSLDGRIRGSWQWPSLWAHPMKGYYATGVERRLNFSLCFFILLSECFTMNMDDQLKKQLKDK